MATSPPALPARSGAEGPDSASREVLLGHRLSYRVGGALVSYLEAVATALNRQGVAVAGMQTTTTDLGLFSGRIQLAMQQPHNLDGAAGELRWMETTGWEVALDAVSPSRFLHADLVPHPEHVASFTAGLLRDEDLGLSYPACFRTGGGDLTAVVGRLSGAVRTMAGRALLRTDDR